MTRRFILWLWLLSSVPVGLLLWILPPGGRQMMFAAAIFLDSAHRIAPIVTAWSHPGFRAVMLQCPRKTIGLPLLLLAVTAIVGVVTSLHWTSLVFARGKQWVITDLSNPFPVMVWTYFLWNGYHFGMQNFGVLSLLRGRRTGWQRTCDMTWTVWITAWAYMTVPAMVQFNHWIVEIALCGKVCRSTLAPLAAILFGMLYFLIWTPTPNGIVEFVIPWLMGLQIGLSFWHFLQDRWMWQLSNRQVRATIGKELFA